MSESSASVDKPPLTVAGLFAGIGGVELGLHRAGATTTLLCELMDSAQAVLRDRFPGVDLHPDVATLETLPDVDVVAAGFPCTDLSQVGRTAGIGGKESGLVSHLFRLLGQAEPKWVVIENVRNMLVLDKGKAMDYLVEQLEALGYRWAYRLVDSRFTGVPQRRQRVIMVASKTEDPGGVLFADDAGEWDEDHYRTDAYGFYWTEGLRGLGWARDATPTVKGGSGLSIPSPPAIWLREATAGRAIGTPSITEAERLQGFPAGWTAAAFEEKAKDRKRWKLVGNAVTVGVSEWIGRRLSSPGTFEPNETLRLSPGERWPAAAYGHGNSRWRVEVSMWPERQSYQHLLDVVSAEGLTPLSRRAVEGFHSRMEQSSLRFDPEFKLAIKEHLAVMQASPRLLV